jgi:hypothetical protein
VVQRQRVHLDVVGGHLAVHHTHGTYCEIRLRCDSIAPFGRDSVPLL